MQYDADKWYDMMLNEIMGKLNVSTELVSQKTTDPVLQRISPTKFKITNFKDVCASMHRSSQDLSEYLLKQIGCEGGLAEEGNNLLIKQKVNLQQIKDIINKYKANFVICNSCGSLQTIVSKSENGKDLVLICDNCKSHRHLKK